MGENPNTNKMTYDEKEYYLSCIEGVANDKTETKERRKAAKDLIQYLDKHNWNGKSPKKDEVIYQHIKSVENEYGRFIG